MKKFILALMLFASFAFGDRTITDQLGNKVVLPDQVNRIVVLQHQSLNVLNEINAMGKVVGVLQSWEQRLGKDYLRLAPSLKNMPTPGDLKTINYEEILSLKPDVVIVTHYFPNEYIQKLRELKIPVVIVSFFKDATSGANKINQEFKNSTEAYDQGFYDGVTLLGEVSNHQKDAKKLNEYVQNAQKELATYTKKIKSKVSVYMANPDMTTYGKGKYTEIFFKRGGGDNVASKDIKGYKQISAESLLKWNPSIIFVQNRYPQVINELKNNPTIKNLEAIKENKIYLMPQYAKAWGHPTAEAMAIGEFWIAKTLYPKIFKNFNLDQKVQDFYHKFYRTSYQK